MKIYTKKHLLDALQEQGLPCTYKTLIKYENLGIIPTASNVQGVGNAGNWRLYTEEDIQKIVQKVREYVDSNKKTNNA